MKLAIQQVSDPSGLTLAPPHMRRDWQDATHNRFANRCLPLLMANSAGWRVEVTHSYRVTCRGGEITVEHDGSIPNIRPLNHFHHGIVTWNSPWLFRTPPGWDLLILPPLNSPLPPGVSALSGLVETDHSVESFTFNYRLDDGVTMQFSPGHLLATLLPYPTDQLAEWVGEFTDEPVSDEFTKWSLSRDQFNATNADPKAWQKSYWNGAKRRRLTLPLKRKGE